MELEGTPPLYSSEGLQVLAGKNVLEKEDVMALLARITDNSRWRVLFIEVSLDVIIQILENSGSSSSRLCLVATLSVVSEDSLVS